MGPVTSHRRGRACARRRGLTAVRLRALFVLLPCLLRLLDEVLPVVDGVVDLGLVRLFLQCPPVCDAVEDAGEKCSVPDNLYDPWRG